MYDLFSLGVDKWIVLAIFVITFALILYRKIPIFIIALAAAALLIILGIMSPRDALLQSVNWDVLGIYWGYGMLSVVLQHDNVPTAVANWVLPHLKKEKYALLFLCALAAALSSFMPNPVVVLMLAPLAIELATRLNASLFLYLIALAISSNVVTTVSMVADPPALILAMSTGMRFLDFYWFQGKVGLGTLSVVGVSVALMTLLVQFRKLNNKIQITPKPVKLGYGALTIFFLSVLALALIPMSHPGIVGIVVAVLSLLLLRRDAAKALKEFDWASMAFLVGIFIVVASVGQVGILQDIANWLLGTGLTSTLAIMVILTWLSVALSSFIDNVPYTVLMIPTCSYIAQALGVSPWAFYYGMLVGTGIGGNITPVGATANVLACGILEKRGYKIELGKYMKIAVPFSVAGVLTTQLLLQWTWLR
jgi:Na+/H+ antiporter NhaD/arsenite permease-like protein